MEETAAAFGITERELVDDLNLLWCIELRSPDPYCPIDLSYEGGEIVVSEAEAIDRPLRLGVDEACALLIALRMLADLPSVGAGSALSRTIAKLELAAGAPPGRAPRSPSRSTTSLPQAAAAEVAEALSGGQALAHCVLRARPGRGDRAGRGPDAAPARRGAQLPGGLVPQRAGCPAVPAGPHPCHRGPGCRQRGPGRRGAGRCGQRPVPALADDVLVVFELAAAGRWVAEYWPDRAGGRAGRRAAAVQLRTPDTQWVRRLALRLGEDGRLVSPPELAEQVIADATTALSHYA